MSCGDEHTAVVCASGRLFTFGANEWGQLGLGTNQPVIKPSCVKSLKPVRSAPECQIKFWVVALICKFGLFLLPYIWCGWVRIHRDWQ